MTIYRKFSDIQANAKLAQLDKHQTGMAEVPSSILTGGNILLCQFHLACLKPFVCPTKTGRN